jgi:TM2 domain-containing membrane protein YozV
MKTKGIIYLLWLLGFFGILGFQHFYLGKNLKGFIWFFTLGLFGFGAFFDLFTMGNAVDTYNTKLELDTIRANELSKSKSNHQDVIGVNQQTKIGITPEKLREIIEANIQNADRKKSFLPEELDEKQLNKISKSFKLINLKSEKLLFAGMYSSFGILLGIIFTDKFMYYRVSAGGMGFLETKHIHLNLIESLDIGYGKGKGIINKQETGADFVVNGKTVGSFTGFTLPDSDEELLKGIFNDLNKLISPMSK